MYFLPQFIHEMSPVMAPLKRTSSITLHLLVLSFLALIAMGFAVAFFHSIAGCHDSVS